MQRDSQGEEKLAQVRSFGEPASSWGEREEEVGCCYRQEVGAPRRPQVGGEKAKMAAQCHVGGAKSS